MDNINAEKIQLPDFQRGWVWDDNRIRALIASITCSFPVGAAMFLDYGNPNIKFKYRHKGFMALIMKNSAQDFISVKSMSFILYKSSNIDNRIIGGDAPSKYLFKIKSEKSS